MPGMLDRSGRRPSGMGGIFALVSSRSKPPLSGSVASSSSMEEPSPPSTLEVLCPDLLNPIPARTGALFLQYQAAWAAKLSSSAASPLTSSSVRVASFDNDTYLLSSLRTCSIRRELRLYSHTRKRLEALLTDLPHNGTCSTLTFIITRPSMASHTPHYIQTVITIITISTFHNNTSLSYGVASQRIADVV